MKDVVPFKTKRPLIIMVNPFQEKTERFHELRNKIFLTLLCLYEVGRDP